jgi:hypothetical protein
MPHHLTPCHFSILKNIFKKSRSMSHHLMKHHLSLLKKIQKKSLYAMSPFSIEKKSDNSSSMPQHLSLLKNNSKNSRKSHHATTPFSI